MEPFVILRQHEPFEFILPKQREMFNQNDTKRAKRSMQLIGFSRYLTEEFTELSLLYLKNCAFKKQGFKIIPQKHAFLRILVLDDRTGAGCERNSARGV
jgi:hypothetical protein